MKILTLTDIHDDIQSARTAYEMEKPDLVLDCGDHSEITNISELTPHFYIFGNHEPQVIKAYSDSMPLPAKIPTGYIFEFSCNGEKAKFSGLDGNYSSKIVPLSVNERKVDLLREISPGSIDLLLLHESPLNVDGAIGSASLAREVLQQIDRIKPQMVIAGHIGKYREDLTPEKIRIITLDDVVHGYGIINVDNGLFDFERKRLRHR